MEVRTLILTDRVLLNQQSLSSFVLKIAISQLILVKENGVIILDGFFVQLGPWNKKQMIFF